MNEIAFRVVAQAVGDIQSIMEKPDVVGLGRRGGIIGEESVRMSVKRRTAVLHSRRVAAVRWNKESA
jgi:hypothetical protein